jgi:hypothetical protein
MQYKKNTHPVFATTTLEHTNMLNPQMFDRFVHVCYINVMPMTAPCMLVKYECVQHPPLSSWH